MKNGKRKTITSFILVLALLMTNITGIFSDSSRASLEVDAATVLSNPKVSNGKTTWDCIWFGSYPQTEIVDKPETCGTYGRTWGKSTDYEVDKTIYNKLLNATDWDSNDCTMINGVKYKRLKSDKATFVADESNHHLTWYYNWIDNDYYHYFRFEKIKWRILKVLNNTAFLLSDVSIDNRPINYNHYAYGTTWENSDMRYWLNSEWLYKEKDFTEDGFSVQAFTDSELNIIQKTDIDNKTNGPFSDIHGGEDTTDLVYLLSHYDCYNTENSVSYGFNYEGKVADNTRVCKSSTFAKAMGAFTSQFDGTVGNSMWWLRSVGGDDKSFSSVEEDGSVDVYGGVGYDDIISVRPVINIKLSNTKLWSYAGTVCSDGTVNENNKTDSENDNPVEDQSTPYFYTNGTTINIDLGTSQNITGSYNAGTITNTNKNVKNIQWSVKDASVAEVENFTYSQADSLIGWSSFTLKIKGKKDGTTTIQGKTPDGQTLSLSIGVKGKQTYGIDLRWGRDNFSFTNSVKGIGVNVGDKYGNYEDAIDKTAFNNIDKYNMIMYLLNGFGGVCFGMSSLTHQLYTNRITTNELQSGISMPFNLKGPSENKIIKQKIGLNQFTVATSTYDDAEEAYTRLDEKEKLKDLVSRLRNIEITNSPILIDFAWISDFEEFKKNKDKGWSAHAVLAYALETEGSPYRWDGVDYEYRIRVLDPNMFYSSDTNIEEANNVCFYITKDYSQCYIPDGKTTSDGAKTYSLKTRNGSNHFLGEFFIQLITDDETILPARFSSGAVSNTRKFYTTQTCLNIDGNIINGHSVTSPGVTGVAIVPEGNSSFMKVFVDNKAHKVKIDSDEQKVSCSNNEYLQDVSASKGSEITFDGKDVKLHNNNGDYNITIVANDDIPSTDSNVIEISGNGQKDIEVEITDNGLEIESDDLPGTSITNDNGKTVVINDKDKVIVKEENGKIEVSQEGQGNSVSKAEITGISDATYTGLEITPNLVVELAGRTLKKDKDYNVTYKNNVNPGTATVVIKGKGEYIGEIQKNFTIRNIPTTTTAANALQYYKGILEKEQRGSFCILHLTNDDIPDMIRILEADDYYIYINGKEAYYDGEKPRTVNGDDCHLSFKYYPKKNFLSLQNDAWDVKDFPNHYRILYKNGDYDIFCAIGKWADGTIRKSVLDDNGQNYDKLLNKRIKFDIINSSELKDLFHCYTDGINETSCKFVSNTVENRNIYFQNSTDSKSGSDNNFVDTAAIYTFNPSFTSFTGIRNKTYTGKAITQNPTIKVHGVLLKKGVDYKISYFNNVNVGTAKVIIDAIGKYKGKITTTFTIYPKGTKISKVQGKKKSFVLKWKKQAKQITGYQIQYALKKNMKSGVKYKKVSGAKKTSVTIKKLKSKKNYFVRIRTYKKVGSKTLYSSWSKIKKVRSNYSAPPTF